MGRKRRRMRLGPFRLGPVFVAFLTGGALLLVALGISGRIRWGRHPVPAPTATATAWNRDACMSALVGFLRPQANWRDSAIACPLHWTGEIPAASSLIQWNARVSRALADLGLEIVSGTEEVIERRSRRPMQRLTLVAGRAGETLATIVVECQRPPQLSPVF